MSTLTRTILVCAAGALLSLAGAADAVAQCASPMAARRPATLKLPDLKRPAAFGDTAGSPGFSEHPSIVGLWKVTLTSGGSVIDVGFDAWHSDGTETLNDSSPISNHICLGVWTQTARREFRLKHPAFRYADDGSLIGTLLLRETNMVNRSGDRFTGTFSIEFFDLDGNSIFQGSGEIVGERVTPD